MVASQVMEHEKPPELDASKPHSRFSGMHLRTYEMELLVSGAVVFALVQLPPHLRHLFDSTVGQMSGTLRMTAIVGVMYASLVVYALIAFFVLHLATRAFWIGLVGLESVFPEGIRWDRLRFGPFTQRLYREKTAGISTLVERLDDVCSLIFSFGFLVVLTFLYSVITILACGLLGLGLALLLADVRSAPRFFWIVFILLASAQVCIQLFDKRFGRRLREDGIPGRLLGALTRIAYAVSPMRWIGSIQLTLQSHFSSSRLSAAMLIFMFGLMFFVVGGILARRGEITFDSLVYFPGDLREAGLDPVHYRNQRVPGVVEPRNPSIQGDVVEGPYLKLFLPYYPRRHNTLMAEQCPEISPFRPAGLVFDPESPDPAAASAAANCLAFLHEISLDGASIAGLRFEFTREAESGVTGIIAYIPTRSLEQGRHELVVICPGKTKDGEDGAPATIRHVIPFWL